MTFSTEEHDAFRAVVRDFARKDLAPNIDRWEAEGGFPARELFTKMGSLGLLGLEYAVEDGGGGADHLYTVILCEELGRCDAMGVPMAIGVQTDMATPSLAKFGSKELKEQFLRPPIEGTAVAAVGVTEPDADGLG